LLDAFCLRKKLFLRGKNFLLKEKITSVTEIIFSVVGEIDSGLRSSYSGDEKIDFGVGSIDPRTEKIISGVGSILWATK
jgi:hypothetical protein